MSKEINVWLRKLTIAFVLVGSLGSPSAYSTGIPVIDVASLAESVRSYVQQLQDYQTYIDQLNVQSNQYVQMVQDYQQTITEYQHFLNQIKSLNLTAAQRQILDAVAQVSYGNQGIGQVATIDPASATFDQDTLTVLRQGGYIARDRADILNDYGNLNPAGTTVTERDIDQINRNAVAYQNQINMVQENERKQSTEFQNKIDTSIMNTDNLGPESDLATMQHVARQQGVMMEQMQEMSRILNQQVMVYESPSQAANKRSIVALEAEIERLERVAARRANEPVVPQIVGHSEILR